MRRVFPEQSEEQVNVKLRNQVRNSFNYWRRALQFDREARYWGKRVSAGHERRKATATTSVCSDADTSLDTSGLGASTSSQSTASTCESQPSAYNKMESCYTADNLHNIMRLVTPVSMQPSNNTNVCVPRTTLMIVESIRFPLEFCPVRFME